MPSTVGNSRLPPFTKQEREIKHEVVAKVTDPAHPLTPQDGNKILYAGLLSGATSGVVTKTGTAPLERIKILSQNNKGEATNMFRMGAQAVKQEGIRSLWKGNAANCLRVVPQYALKFGVNDYIKDLVRDKKDSRKKLELSQLMLSGSISGFITMVSCHPLQVIRTRLSLASSNQGLAGTIAETARKEGVRGFYVGIGPAIVSGTPYIALQMTFHYGIFKPMMPAIALDGTWPNAAIGGTLASAMSGLCSNWCAQLITYPGEVVRTRLITDGQNGKPKVYTGAMDVFMKVLRNEGVKGLFKGYLANAVRAIPASMLQFAIMDGMRDFYLNASA